MDFQEIVRKYVPIRVLCWYNRIADQWDKITAWWWKFRNY